MKNTHIYFCILIIICLTGCATVDPYKYKDSRMVFKINVGKPETKKIEQPFFLINKKITILPFIDNRNLEKATFATDIPCSLLFAKTFYKSLYENFVFNKIQLASEDIYKNKTIIFDKTDFLMLKNKLQTDGIMWGIIYEFDINISAGTIPQQYILNLRARGDIKIMTDDGTITYYHDYEKSRSYTFTSDSSISYSLYDIYSLGPYINNFIEWIAEAEINHLITNSDEFAQKKFAIENLMPDVLTHPQETKLYDAAIITSSSFQKKLINATGAIAGAVGGFLSTYYLCGGDNNAKAKLCGLIIGMPIGMLSGYFIANIFAEKMYEENEKKAIFYAEKNKYDFIFYFPVLNVIL